MRTAAAAVLPMVVASQSVEYAHVTLKHARPDHKALTHRKAQKSPVTPWTRAPNQSAVHGSHAQLTANGGPPKVAAHLFRPNLAPN
eukprot:6015828-Prymnesium_polylepis.1